MRQMEISYLLIVLGYYKYYDIVTLNLCLQ